MEARGLIRESVSRSVKSQGFFFYLADHPEDEALANAGDTEKVYRHFLRWLSGTLSEELGALFAPDDPADRLYPPLRVLDQVLDVRPSYSEKAGGQGDRYTVRIQNKERHLFFEHNPVFGQAITGRWFVERK
jgi:hypothetical protein